MPMRVRERRARRAPPAGEQQLLLAVGGGVGPELERHGDHLVAGVERELGGGGAVDAAAHGDERAPRAPRQPRGAALGGRAERAVQRVGRELRGVALRRRQPAQRVRDVFGAHTRRTRGRARPRRAPPMALPAAVQRAAALGVEARLGDAVALDAHRDAHEVAAGGAAGRAGVGRSRRGRPCPRARRDDRRTTALSAKAIGRRAASPTLSTFCTHVMQNRRRWPQPAVVGSGSWACCRSKSGCPPGRTTALPRVGLPYRWYSAQHVRPTGEQARA